MIVRAIQLAVVLTLILPAMTRGAEKIVAAGDQHACQGDGDEATAKLLDAATVITVGDLGTRECYDQTWGAAASRTLAVAGNHDYADSPDFYARFADLLGPARHPSYYRVARGAWQLYILDTNCGFIDCSAQQRWLRRQLQRHPARCIAAFMHHPPRTSTRGTSYLDAIALRDILNARGADLLVSGHRHGYERFARLESLREIVVGTGGSDRWPRWREPRPSTEVRIFETWGVLNVTLRWNRAEWHFTATGGSTLDSGVDVCSR